MKKVTVITASYNHAEYIEESIQSVLNQSFQDFNYIIWDDGSSDTSRDIIKKYADMDSRILFRTHENKANKGLPATMEACVSMVDTPYIAILESDDFWDTSFLETMLKSIEQYEDVGIAYSAVHVFGENAEKEVKKHEEMLQKRKDFISKSFLDRSSLLFIPPISTLSSLLVRSDFLKQCDFNPSVPASLDKYLYAQCMPQKPSLFVDKELCHWRKHATSLTAKSKKLAPFALQDMLFDVLYPEARSRAIYHTLLSGKKEKLFRSFLRKCVCLLLQLRYGRKKLTFYKVEIAPRIEY